MTWTLRCQPRTKGCRSVSGRASAPSRGTSGEGYEVAKYPDNDGQDDEVCTKSRQDKERKYFELLPMDRCRLVVIALETDGRWSEDVVQRMLDFGQFDFGQFDFGQLTEVEFDRSRNWPKSKLAEVEKKAGQSRNWPKSIALVVQCVDDQPETHHQCSEDLHSLPVGGLHIVTFIVSAKAS